MRSLVAKLVTGLWLQEWRNAYTLAQYHARLTAEYSAFAAMVPAHLNTFDEWFEAAWHEARFRQMIAEMRGRDLSFRAAIRQVIDEVTRPGKPQEVTRG